MQSGFPPQPRSSWTSPLSRGPSLNHTCKGSFHVRPFPGARHQGPRSVTTETRRVLWGALGTYVSFLEPQ